jgi:hypothetical protein
MIPITMFPLLIETVERNWHPHSDDLVLNIGCLLVGYVSLIYKHDLMDSNQLS